MVRPKCPRAPPQPQPPNSCPHPSPAVLLGSSVLEAYSLGVAYRMIQRSAQEQGQSVWQYIRRGRDPTTVGTLVHAGLLPGVALLGRRGQRRLQVLCGGSRHSTARYKVLTARTYAPNNPCSHSVGGWRRCGGAGPGGRLHSLDLLHGSVRSVCGGSNGQLAEGSYRVRKAHHTWRAPALPVRACLSPRACRPAALGRAGVDCRGAADGRDCAAAHAHKQALPHRCAGGAPEGPVWGGHRPVCGAQPAGPGR